MKTSAVLLLMSLAGWSSSCEVSRAAEPSRTSTPATAAAAAAATCGANPTCAASQFCFRNTECWEKLAKNRPCDNDGNCISNSCPVIEGSCISPRTGLVIECKDDSPCDRRYGHGCTLPQKTCL